jgi:lipopolysaccharide/colanic/teichoic acid biosynthesis glycosyltransferase
VDCVVAGTVLLLAAPLLLTVAVAVRLTSPGPSWYRQVRVGRSGRLFTMLKFRTMVAGADNMGPLVTDQADPRVTRMGSWLRATKLDELPQLLNVARGDMTLVGPRPEVPHFLPHYEQDELDVLLVRPGLTGAGQIVYPEVPAADPGDVAGAEERYVRWQLHPKLAIDLDYLRRRSLATDLRLVLGTVGLIVCRRRAAVTNLAGTDPGVADPVAAATPDASRPLAPLRRLRAHCGSPA